MSPPGRPKGSCRRAQPEGTPMSPPGRPKGSYRRAQPEGTPVSPTSPRSRPPAGQPPGRPSGPRSDRPSKPRASPAARPPAGPRPGVADEFSQFLAFLRNLWSALAGVSILFPLSNVFAQLIPVAQWSEGGFVRLAPPLVTAVATVASLFVLLWTYGHRDRLAQRGARWRARRHAGAAFGLGLVALGAYLALQFAVKEDFYFRVLGWHSDDLRRLLGDLVLLLAYSLFFALLTRAFVLLGMIEYFGQRQREARS